MTILVVHQNARCNVSIALHSLEKAEIDRIRVVCSAVSDLLMLYIPGIYMALLDVGTIDDSHASLVFSGNEHYFGTICLLFVCLGSDAVPVLPRIASNTAPSQSASACPLACEFELPMTDANGVCFQYNCIVDC